ncbi:MAG: uracil-DNA glycosylase [Thermoplasmatales archaeon]|nr:uracil-DNA glycosylase [Candidatus Thermoplasmatota archaeon]MCL6003602.1 uracil-DNA glycosylase [Candidatus Thermoplasmatota archaeon]MDA8054978.1 uracil-DNA glycosylase [Thermoplasmatales archaeon]
MKFRVEVAGRRSRFLGEDFWSKPVPGFGNIDSRLLILGLAPAATGGNRTGRVFTGDKSASFLFSCLYEVGLSNKPDSVSRNDGLSVEYLYTTAVLKCVPPGDKPVNGELENCREYREFEIEYMKNLRVVLALGRIAFDTFKAYQKSRGFEVKDVVFKHGAGYRVGNTWLYASYHPSPRNVNTGRLTKEQLVEVLLHIKEKFLT